MSVAPRSPFAPAPITYLDVCHAVHQIDPRLEVCWSWTGGPFRSIEVWVADRGPSVETEFVAVTAAVKGLYESWVSDPLTEADADELPTDLAIFPVVSIEEDPVAQFMHDPTAEQLAAQIVSSLRELTSRAN